MSLSLREPTSDDIELPRIDFSQANELYTCPFKGNLKYTLNKSIDDKDSSQSLKFGRLGHDCFAAIRLWWLANRQNFDKEILIKKCKNLKLEEFVLEKNDNDAQTALSMVVYNVISNSGYEDNIKDKKRTKENLLISMNSYISKFIELMKTESIWFDKDKIGVEVPFEIVINDTFVFIGRIDGIHKTNGTGKILPVENKTSSLINEEWLNQWELSNQIQGYCVAATHFTGIECDAARIIGLQTPEGKTSPWQSSIIYKNMASIRDWFMWLYACVNLKNKNITQCIHNRSACYNYFRMCDFSHICMAKSDDERMRLINDLHDITWNPIEQDT